MFQQNSKESSLFTYSPADFEVTPGPGSYNIQAALEKDSRLGVHTGV